MPVSEPRTKPRADEQVGLRAALEELVPGLRGKASLLVRGLRPPKPDPQELVNETIRRLLARYADVEVESVSGLAFTTLTRLVCDLARRAKRFDGGLIEDDTKVPDETNREIDPMVRATLDKLEGHERCIVLRIVVEDVAVPKAFELCDWDTPSPYAEYKKVLRRLRDHFEETE